MNLLQPSKKQNARGCGGILGCGVAGATTQNRLPVMLWSIVQQLKCIPKKCLTLCVGYVGCKYVPVVCPKQIV